jgi:hypothetical protein
VIPNVPKYFGRWIKKWIKVVVPHRGTDQSLGQPLAVVKSTFDIMKQFSMFATLAAASGGSALSR